MSDRIEKVIVLKAAVDRVWRAISEAEEFGNWFGAVIDMPFAEGKRARGRITIKGYENLPWEVDVVSIDAPHRFAFTWHPYAIDPGKDYSAEEPTLVEFLLKPHQDGTELTVIESGFSGVPEGRREEAMRMNSDGWAHQVENVRAYVDG